MREIAMDTVRVKKTPTQIFVYISANYWPIFKISSVMILKQSDH